MDPHEPVRRSSSRSSPSCSFITLTITTNIPFKALLRPIFPRRPFTLQNSDTQLPVKNTQRYFPRPRPSTWLLDCVFSKILKIPLFFATLDSPRSASGKKSIQFFFLKRSLSEEIGCLIKSFFYRRLSMIHGLMVFFILQMCKVWRWVD